MNHEHTNKLHRLRTLHLFAGAGGGILADILLGHQPVCAVEIEPYCQQVLHARQKDGFLPWFPIFDDVKTFDGKPWRGLAEVVCGGFPCQDISSAGKGAGISGERSGLWGEMARVVCEVRPRYVFVENSSMLTLRGLGRVLRDLAEMGYNAKWCVLGACDAGAPHQRERIWIFGYLADAAKLLRNGGDNHAGSSMGRQIPESGNCSGAESLAESNGERMEVGGRNTATSGASGCGSIGGGNGGGNGAGNIATSEDADMADAERGGLQSGNEQRTKQTAVKPSSNCGRSRRMQHGEAWRIEPDVGRVAYGVAFGMDRLKALGNGQVPQCAALAWRTLSEGMI